MNFRLKLLLLAILPVIFVSLAALFIINHQSDRLARIQGAEVEEFIRQAKRNELLNYIKLAQSAVEPFYGWDNVSRIQAQKYVTDLLNEMTFGDDGYFFAYNQDGTNLVQPHLSHMVGKNWIDLKDSDGRPVIRDLISLGQEGGEFYQYLWNKPSTGEEAEKLGYSFFLDDWGWMIGSGLYIDDIAAQIDSIRLQMDKNFQQSRWVLIVVAVSAVALTGLLFATLQVTEQRLANSRLRQLAARIVNTQEQERKRVSSELHDSISQLLVSARYGLESSLAELSAIDDDGAAGSIERSMKALDDAIAEVRRISRALRPSVLDDMGLAAALTSLGSEFSKQSDIAVSVNAENCSGVLTEEARTALYRVVQEALTNVARHSGADRVQIRLRKTGRYVVLDLDDNGTGIRGRADRLSSGGLGIRNMQERITSLGGSIRFSNSGSGGLAINVSLPVLKGKTGT